MRRAIVAAAVFSTFAVSAAAQETKPADPAPLQLTDQQDHALMMKALNIKLLRRAPTAEIPGRPMPPTTTSRRPTPIRTCPTPSS